MLVFLCGAASTPADNLDQANSMATTSRERAATEIVELRQQIDGHNYQYYVLVDPLISDADSDFTAYWTPDFVKVISVR